MQSATCKMQNLGVLVLAIVIGGVALVSLGQSDLRSYHAADTPPTSDDVRPWLHWQIHYMTDDGVRLMDGITVRTLDEAIGKFRGDHGPDVMITCIASAYYNYCGERVW